MTTNTRAGGIHRLRCPLRALPARPLQAREGQGGQRVRRHRHGHRAGRDHLAGRRARRERARDPAAHRGRHGHRGQHRPVAGSRRRDDPDARAGRDAAQLRRPGRRARRVQLLPQRRGPDGFAGHHPQRRGLPRGVHRRGDVHRLDRGLPQAERPHQVLPADAARPALAQPRGGAGLHRPARVVRRLALGRAAAGDDGDRAGVRVAPGRLDRRRRHAGGRLHAQQLLRVGGRRGRLHARQRPAHRHRRPGRLLGCDPQLHHVPGDEPLVRLGDRRRLRPGGLASARTRTTASTARPTPPTSPSCSRTPPPS